METKDELLSEGEKYFEKVMQDFNQNRKGRNLRKYCKDEGIDYKWLSEYKRTYGATKTASATKNKVSKKDGVVDDFDMESKECTIVAYADGAEGQVAECCFRGLKLRQKYRNVKYNCLFC